MKITWAVDIFGTSKNEALKIGRFLKLFALRKGDISVAYVATPQENRLNLAFNIPESERFSKYPRMLLQNLIAQSGLSTALQDCVVLSSQSLTLTEGVDELCSAVKRSKPDLIALQTHQRKGLERALLGSFAETMIHRSRLSLLLMNPWHRLPHKVNNIIFSDDLTPTSAKARKFVASLAAQFKANVTIVHADYLYNYGRKNKVSGIEDYRHRIDRHLNRTEAYLTKRGIRAKTLVNGGNKSVADAVLDTAKVEKADLIVVSAKAGPFLALLGGSVTRKIVRKSVLPVIVYKS